jgi:hypothetical protein
MVKKDDAFKSILKNISSSTSSASEEFKLVTSQDGLSMKPVTLGQQKELLSNTLVEQPNRLDTNIQLTKLLLENAKAPEKIYALDRDFILLQYRRSIAGKDLVLYTDDTPYTIDLDKHLEECTAKIAEREYDSEFTVTKDTITLTCGVPKLSRDYEVTTHSQDQYRNMQAEMEESEATKKAVEIAYLAELVKYVEKVKIGEDEIDFLTGDVSLDQQLQLLNALPYTLTSELSRKVSEIVETFADLIVTDQLPTGPIGISIDTQLFSVE